MTADHILWIYREHNCHHVIPDVVFRVYPSLQYYLDGGK